MEEELEKLEDLKNGYLDFASFHKSNADLFKGLIYDLLLGILGNLAVQHWYPIFEVLVG